MCSSGSVLSVEAVLGVLMHSGRKKQTVRRLEPEDAQEPLDFSRRSELTSDRSLVVAISMQPVAREPEVGEPLRDACGDTVGVQMAHLQHVSASIASQRQFDLAARSTGPQLQATIIVSASVEALVLV